MLHASGRGARLSSTVEWAVFWHTQTYRFAPLPEIRRAYPLYPSAAAAVAAIREHGSLELEKAQGLPAWNTFLTAQQMADRTLPLYARTLMLYRGHGDTSWPLMPTLYRNLGPRDHVESELRRRHEQRARVIASVFDHPTIEEVLPGSSALSDLQKEAVARHYGAPSGFVDLTCEPNVAAAFATNGPDGSDVGCIYAINVVEVLSLAGGSSSRGIPGGCEMALSPLEVTVIHYLAPNPPHPPTEQTATIRFARGAWKRARIAFNLVGVPNVARIEAQRGVFISISGSGGSHYARDMWHLVDIVSQKYFFRHTSDPFTSDDPAFREEILLPQNDPIALMAGV